MDSFMKGAHKPKIKLKIVVVNKTIFSKQNEEAICEEFLKYIRINFIL